MVGVAKCVDGYGLCVRPILFFLFDLVSYGAGLTPIKTWRFAVATLAGLIPASFLLAHFGGELTTSSLNQVMYILLGFGYNHSAHCNTRFFKNGWFSNMSHRE